MRLLNTFHAKAAGIAMAFFALASGASASEIRMHVPVTLRWGAEILPAGDYRFSFSNASPFAQLSGNGKLATVFVTSAMPVSPSEHSQLRIVDVNGIRTVAGFDSGSQGITYRFVVPKSTPANRTVLAGTAPGM